MSNRTFEYVVWLIIATALLSVAIILIHGAYHPPPPRPCSAYGNYPLSDVPARCIKEYQK